jgi:cytidylate kinase
MDRKIVPHEKFVAYLTRMVIGAARHGPAVFVGRGAQFLLPRHEVLAVRLVASMDYRIRQIMEKRKISDADAKRFIVEADAGRRLFCERFFRRDVTDPHLFDLLINVERCGKAAAVEQIVAAVREVRVSPTTPHMTVEPAPTRS